jgi:predicted Zn-dependent peptidase
MSSRLFQKLREDRGYCYSIQTSTVTLQDAGAFSLYAGVDPKNLRRAVGLILRELETICRKKPGKEELRKAQDYTIGQTLMGLESTTNQMMWMGESLLGYRHVLDPGEIERRIIAVTADDVQRCACYCLNRGRLGVALVGPQKEAGEIESWLA